MRYFIRTFTAFIFIFITTLHSSDAQDNKLPNLGLVGELSYYKQTAENHAIRIFNDKRLSDESKSALLTRYNDLRVISDQLILQLISDMHKKKRINYFKNLDAYFYEGKKSKNHKVEVFLVNWNEFTATYADMIQYPTQQYMDSIIAEYSERNIEEITQQNSTQTQGNIKVNPADPLASIGSLFSIYKNIKANNLQKVANIVELLNTLRLRDASELIADEKELIETKMEPQK